MKTTRAVNDFYPLLSTPFPPLDENWPEILGEIRVTNVRVGQLSVTVVPEKTTYRRK